MGKLILRPETQEVMHRPDLTEDVEGYEDAVVLDVPPDFTMKDKRVDWVALAVVDNLNAIRDRRWEEAQAYREVRRNAPRAVYGVFPDRPVTVKMDVESRLTISGAVTTATIFKASGLPFSFTFDDEAGEDTTVDADQTIALGLGVAIYSGLCDARLRAIRIALDAALAAGASADEINAIPITTGYPSSEASS